MLSEVTVSQEASCFPWTDSMIEHRSTSTAGGGTREIYTLIDQFHLLVPPWLWNISILIPCSPTHLSSSAIGLQSHDVSILNSQFLFKNLDMKGVYLPCFLLFHMLFSSHAFVIMSPKWLSYTFAFICIFSISLNFTHSCKSNSLMEIRDIYSGIPHYLCLLFISFLFIPPLCIHASFLTEGNHGSKYLPASLR